MVYPCQKVVCITQTNSKQSYWFALCLSELHRFVDSFDWVCILPTKGFPQKKPWLVIKPGMNLEQTAQTWHELGANLVQTKTGRFE